MNQDLHHNVLSATMSFQMPATAHAETTYVGTSHEMSAPSPKAYRVLKRAVGFMAALVALLMLSPLFLILAVLIKLDSPGPIFYISKRMGEGCRVFNFYKFRTMRKDADKLVKKMMEKNQYTSADGQPMFFKVENDPRITKLGAFLRRTSIDELPQLFNILKGDMFFIGNRPLPLYEAKTLQKPEYLPRFMAPAGITGLWQVEKRGKGEMSVEERIQLDIDYARNYSLFTDMKILLRTPFAMIQEEKV